MYESLNGHQSANSLRSITEFRSKIQFKIQSNPIRNPRYDTIRDPRCNSIFKWAIRLFLTYLWTINKTALAIQDGFPDRHTIPLCFCIHLQFSSRNPKYLDMKALWGPLFPEELQEQLQKFRPPPPPGWSPRKTERPSLQWQRCTVAKSQPVDLNSPWRILMLIFTTANTDSNTDTSYANTDTI